MVSQLKQFQLIYKNLVQNMWKYSSVRSSRFHSLARARLSGENLVLYSRVVCSGLE